MHQYLADLPVQLIDSYAIQIDNNGTIVGWGNDAQFRHFAIAWTPVPEPASLGLVAIAAAILTIRSRKG